MDIFSNQLDLILEDAVDSEYWIDNHGSVMSADGDVGMYNHEVYVIDHVRYEIADAFGLDWHPESMMAWDEIVEEIIQTSVEDGSLTEFPDDYDQALASMLTNLGIEHAEEYVLMADGQGDPRAFAIEHWGWKRVAGDNIESWRLTPEDMKVIAAGLDDILFDTEDFDENTHEFYISTYTGPSFEVTLPELRAGKLKSIDSKGIKHEREIEAAKMQIRDLEKDQLHPYYQKRTFPFGD